MSKLDSNATLLEMLVLADDILNGLESTESVRLADLVIALNRWIVSGGALPTTWDKEFK